MTDRLSKYVFVLGQELLVAILVMTFFVVIPVEGGAGVSPAVAVSFAVNGALWLSLLLREVRRRAYSLMLIMWTFFLLFFFFAALVQYLNGTFPWVDSLSESQVIATNLVLTLWTASIVLGKKCAEGVMAKRTNLVCLGRPRIMDCTRYVTVFLLGIVLIAAWRLWSVGLSDLWARSTSSSGLETESSSLSLLFSHGLQAVAYFCVAYLIFAAKQDRVNLWRAWFAALLMLLVYPPTGISRYAAAAIYLGLLITASRRLKSGSTFLLLLLVGFATALPLLNAFRHEAFGEVDILETLQSLISKFSTEWTKGDYDAYSMLACTISEVEKSGITWGRQLFGVLLFWIPRSVWPSKPIGSGAYIAGQVGWTFSNISCPLPGEAVVNFGIIGLPLFAFSLGLAMRLVDMTYWSKRDEKRPRLIDAIYPVSTIFLFFMCRGDLMSSFSYLMAFVVTGLVLGLALCPPKPGRANP